VDLKHFQALLSPTGQEALQAAVDLHPKESNFLREFDTLSRRYPPDLARTALEVAILRLEAQVKFPFAVDVLVRTPQQVAERLAIGDVFLKEIFDKGVVLYEATSRRF